MQHGRPLRAARTLICTQAGDYSGSPLKEHQYYARFAT
jgi:hypothetical protein